MTQPLVINLWPLMFLCWICGDESDSCKFVWQYEDIILPDDTTHERGGQHVCGDCYERARLLTDDFTKPTFAHEVREV